MEQFLMLLNQMAPYLLFGFLMAGVMHAFIPRTVYSRYLAQRSFRSVGLATLFGIPLPLCSCGVIPTAMSLRREGASKGATTAFLIATPQTGVDSIIATFSLMGLPFAVLRPVAALATALMGGQLVNITEGDDSEAASHRTECHCGERTPMEATTFGGRVRVALRYAFVDMMQDIGKWLIVGLFVAGMITVFVPDSAFAIFRDNSLASMLLVLCIAVPMYLCATGSIPIAVALMMKGLTPGAALVLLMAGPACNMASILVINKVLGRRTMATYLASIIAGAVGFGLMIDHVLPRQWFVGGLISQGACCHEHYSLLNIGCTVVLIVLLLNAMLRYFCDRRNANPSVNNSDNMKESSSVSPLSAPDNTVGSTNASSDATFVISGMNCNHCRTAAENAILSVPGVTSASVSLSTRRALVSGTASARDICKAVEEVGFTCEKA